MIAPVRVTLGTLRCSFNRHRAAGPARQGIRALCCRLSTTLSPGSGDNNTHRAADAKVLGRVNNDKTADALRLRANAKASLRTSKQSRAKPDSRVDIAQ
jgi:hypothetical protein